MRADEYGCARVAVIPGYADFARVASRRPRIRSRARGPRIDPIAFAVRGIIIADLSGPVAYDCLCAAPLSGSRRVATADEEFDSAGVRICRSVGASTTKPSSGERTLARLAATARQAAESEVIADADVDGRCRWPQNRGKR
jgi:hypothetical protein